MVIRSVSFVGLKLRDTCPRERRNVPDGIELRKRAHRFDAMRNLIRITVSMLD